ETMTTLKAFFAAIIVVGLGQTAHAGGVVYTALPRAREGKIGTTRYKVTPTPTGYVVSTIAKNGKGAQRSVMAYRGQNLAGLSKKDALNYLWSGLKSETHFDRRGWQVGETYHVGGTATLKNKVPAAIRREQIEAQRARAEEAKQWPDGKYRGGRPV